MRIKIVIFLIASVSLGYLFLNNEESLSQSTLPKAIRNRENYFYDEYDKISRDVKIFAQFEINIENSTPEKWIVELEDENSEEIDDEQNPDIVNKSETVINTPIPTGSVNISTSNDINVEEIIRKWKIFRMQELVIEPFLDTGPIAKGISNILFHITSKKIDKLEGEYVLPPNRYNSDSELDIDATFGANLNLKDGVDVEFLEELCTEYYCINLDIVSGEKNNTSEAGNSGDGLSTRGQYQKIIGALDQINKNLKEMSEENLSLRCTNRQTFGARFKMPFNFIKENYVHIIFKDNEIVKKPNPVKEEDPISLYSDIECEQIIQRAQGEISATSIESVNKEAIIKCNNEKNERAINRAENAFEDISELEDVFYIPFQKLVSLQNLISEFSGNLYRYSVILENKSQAE